jgi:protoporphyrinogen IX oxidase
MPSVDFYNLGRALHILAVIAWMAGLLMLPRLYAYQTEAQPGGELEAKMIEASRRLRKIILTPAMILTWVFGLYLLIQYNLGPGIRLWLWAKLALVVALSGLHGYYVMQGKKMEAGLRPLSSKTWRLLNEVPFLIAIPVVIFATLEPF